MIHVETGDTTFVNNLALSDSLNHLLSYKCSKKTLKVQIVNAVDQLLSSETSSTTSNKLTNALMNVHPIIEGLPSNLTPIPDRTWNEATETLFILLKAKSTLTKYLFNIYILSLLIRIFLNSNNTSTVVLLYLYTYSST